MKKYELTITENENGYVEMHSRNDGFNELEIIRILEKLKQDILKRIYEKSDEDEIKKEVVTD